LALSGDLKDFGILQLLTLVQVTGKSGGLTLTHGNESAALYFENGLLTKVRPSETRAEGLATALFRAGRINRERYEQITTQAPPSEQAVGILLTDQAGLTQEEIVDFIRERTLAELHVLLTWPDGSFLFDVNAPPPEDSILAPTELAPVIQQARSFLDEWQLLASYIPSLDRPLRLLPEPRNPVQQISLNLPEWRMVACLSGDVPLREVAQRLGLDDFAVRKVAYRLINAGLADVPEPQQAAPAPPPFGGERDLEQAEQRPGAFSRLFGRGNK
jgi:hypothetical protein